VEGRNRGDQFWSSPGADKQDNWIPAPKDNFSLYIRAYWPKEELTSGRGRAHSISVEAGY